MNPITKKSIAVIIVAFIAVVMYYGTYLPLHKSQSFIEALRNLQNVRSLGEFESSFALPLDIPAPVGQEELVRNLAGIIVNYVQRAGNNVDAAKELIRYITAYYDPIISRGRGMSFEQNLYVLGIINQSTAVVTKDSQYLVNAQHYFERGLELGPKRPQFLYGLFDLYQMEGNSARAIQIGNQILEQWPTDAQVRVQMAKLEAPPAQVKK